MSDSTEQKSYGGIPVDPRVEWAMEVMDTEDYNFSSWYEEKFIPATLAAMPVVANSLYNFSAKAPVKTNLPLALALAPLGWLGGMKMLSWRFNVNAENMAVARHYILTHPERFPEPKRPKFGDMILPWLARR
jgi:hypothetical protein